MEASTHRQFVVLRCLFRRPVARHRSRASRPSLCDTAGPSVSGLSSGRRKGLHPSPGGDHSPQDLSETTGEELTRASAALAVRLGAFSW